MDVTSSDEVKLGTVREIGLTKERRKKVFIIEGPLISEIRGKTQEIVKLDDIVRIRNYIQIGLEKKDFYQEVKKESR